jgi:hypothetical protein
LVWLHDLSRLHLCVPCHMPPFPLYHVYCLGIRDNMSQGTPLNHTTPPLTRCALYLRATWLVMLNFCVGSRPVMHVNLWACRSVSSIASMEVDSASLSCGCLSVGVGTSSSESSETKHGKLHASSKQLWRSI